MRKIAGIIGIACFLGMAVSGYCQEEELQGEIVSLDGAARVVRADGSQANLSEGDVVKIGETVQTGPGASAVLSFDGDFKNSVQLAEDTDLKIESIYPTTLQMTKGDVLSKLESLPQGSTFEIETPVGTAAVRGSEFRTVYGGEGMEIFNLEHSNVYVFNKDENGELAETPVVVPQLQKTAMGRRGEKPHAPQQIPQQQLEKARFRQNQMQQGKERRIAQGLPPRIPRLDQVKRIHQEKMEHIRQSGGPNRQDRMMQRMDGADRGPNNNMRRNPNPANIPDETGFGGKQRAHQDGRQGFQDRRQENFQDRRQENFKDRRPENFQDRRQENFRDPRKFEADSRQRQPNGPGMIQRGPQGPGPGQRPQGVQGHREPGQHQQPGVRQGAQGGPGVQKGPGTQGGGKAPGGSKPRGGAPQRRGPQK